MTHSRRHILSALAGGGALAGLAACAPKADQGAQAVAPNVAPQFDMPSLPQALLVNRERASDVMKTAGVSAIICAVPRNIYYVTNYLPQLSTMGMEGYAYAILPADSRMAPVLVETQFAYYLAATEGVTSKFVEPRLFTMPADPGALSAALLEQIDAPAFPSFLPAKRDAAPLNHIEKYKRELTEQVKAPLAVNSQAALVKALIDLNLDDKRLSVDDAFTQHVLGRANIVDVDLRAENLLRSIRLQKSPAEIELMRFAARENANAALAAAKLVRDGASFQDMRRSYYDECAQRLMTPEFMVIDGVIPEMAQGEIKDGRAFLIDCVSQFEHYHGDYGRTVCVGEPTREIALATEAVSQVWDDLLPRLKPGVSYEQIGQWGRETFDKMDSPANLIVNPHSVGLLHTDEPSANDLGYFEKDNLTLMEGMIISVDLPMTDVGLGGSAHLEDLVLIKADGAEFLNDSGDRVIIV